MGLMSSVTDVTLSDRSIPGFVPVAEILPIETPPTSAHRTHAEEDAARRFFDRALLEALDVARRSRTLAERHPRSGVAWARAAQASSIANDVDGAVEAARACLSVVDVEDPGSGAIVQVAVTILVEHGLVDDVDALLDRLERGGAQSILRADMYATLGRHEDCLRVLESTEGPWEDSLRGYCHLALDHPQQAVRHLRSAIRAGAGVDVNVSNLAVAFWRLGSRRKAIRAAREAVVLAPHRRRNTIALLRYLSLAGEWRTARNEIDLLRHRGAVDSAELLRLDASVELNLGHAGRAVDALRRAARAASDEGDELLRAEIDGSIALLEWSRGRSPRERSRDTVASLLALHPSSTFLLLRYLQLSEDRRSAELADTYRQHLSEVPAVVDAELRTRIAYLLCDFTTAAAQSQRWLSLAPDDEAAVASSLLLVGSIGDGWRAAAAMASRIFSRRPQTEFLCNQTAYVLAMAGEGARALALVSQIKLQDYRSVATRGLALLADGRTGAGLAEYRRAFAMIPGGSDGDEDRVLMALHQAQGVLQLGLVVPARAEELRAGALPALPLPENWEDRSAFVLLEQSARRRGWAWPTQL